MFFYLKTKFLRQSPVSKTLFLNKKTGRWTTPKKSTIVLIYHRHKRLDLIHKTVFFFSNPIEKYWPMTALRKWPQCKNI
jgi:hypothetical protein